VHRVLLELQVQQDLLVIKDLQGRLVLLALQVLQVYLALLALQEFKGHRDQLVVLVKLESQAPRELLEPVEPQDLPGHLERLDLLESRVLQE